MYTENQIIEIMQLRTKRWSLLSNDDNRSQSDTRSLLNTVNRRLYKITGKRQYL